MKVLAVVFIGLMMGIGVSASGLGQNESNLIDTPTAKTLDKNHYYLNFRFYHQGGLLIQGAAGLAEKLTVGASYGGTGVIGTETVKGNPEPAFSLKYKLGEEGENLPFALSFGYEGQGYGEYYKEGERIKIDGESKKFTRSFYQINSKGFYLVASKRLEDLHLNIHGGLNHSLEDDPGKAGVSLFLGAEFKATPRLAIKLEYNNGFHREIKWEDVVENPSGLEGVLRKAGGEVNLGFRVQYTPGLTLELDFKDLSHRYTETGNRIFQITYSGEF